jgi:tetratricopeptide (TPR) repeat protein
VNNEEEKEQAALWETASKSEGEEKVDALLQLSYNAAGRREYVESLAFCETAKEVYEGLGALASNMKLAHIYFGIGHSLRNLKRATEAANALETSVQLYEEVGSEEAVHILNEEGDAWYEAKEYQKSYDAYRRGIENSNPDTCDYIVARNYVDAGTALERLKQWDKALTYFLEARSRFKKLKDPTTVAHCDEEISYCYYWLNDGVNSLHYAQLALDFAVTANNESHLIWAKSRMALAKKRLAEYQEALELFSEVKLMMTRQEYPPWKAIVKQERQMADILQKLGRETEGNEILRRISSLADIVLNEEEKEQDLG